MTDPRTELWQALHRAAEADPGIQAGVDALFQAPDITAEPPWAEVPEDEQREAG